MIFHWNSFYTKNFALSYPIDVVFILSYKSIFREKVYNLVGFCQPYRSSQEVGEHL